MAVAKKPIWPWIVGGIVAIVLLCCGGGAALTCFGVKKGFESAAELAPLTTDILTKMSDSNYSFDAVKDKFDSGVFGGSEGEKLQSAMNGYRDKLGKFVSLGNVKGFQSNYNNGVSTRSGTFDAKFEKGPATVEITTEDQNGKPVVIGFFIKADALNR